MKKLMIIGLLLILAFGCVTQPATTPPETKPPVTQKTCHNVTELVPITTQECGNVSYSEEVCANRKLSYVATREPKVDLCIVDGPCVGNPLGECPGCSKAMTRCVLIIHNEEAQKSGTWTATANFTLGSAGFNKEPITQTIAANESEMFDFFQIYTPGSPTNSASCTIAVTGEPVIEDCIQEMRTKTECTNVTRNNTNTREVCQ